MFPKGTETLISFYIYVELNLTLISSYISMELNMPNVVRYKGLQQAWIIIFNCWCHKLKVFPPSFCR